MSQYVLYEIKREKAAPIKTKISAVYADHRQFIRVRKEITIYLSTIKNLTVNIIARN
jgi:hypothetical protein